MSALSIWQKAQIEEAIQLLNRAYMSIDLAVSADAVDEQEDLEALEKNRDEIAKAIVNLRPLVE
jgi:hypothetical protein